MKSNEFKRRLAAQGATFKPGKGSHFKVFLHDKELGTGLVNAIKKQLGLKKEDK